MIIIFIKTLLTLSPVLQVISPVSAGPYIRAERPTTHPRNVSICNTSTFVLLLPTHGAWYNKLQQPKSSSVFCS